MIKENTPDGATHYYLDDDGDIWYVKLDLNSDVWLWFNGKWIRSAPNKMLGHETPL
jgi:hypothetical protein